MKGSVRHERRRLRACCRHEDHREREDPQVSRCSPGQASQDDDAAEERRREKEAKREERKKEKADRPPVEPGEDPDIAGIVPGPQPIPEE